MARAACPPVFQGYFLFALADKQPVAHFFNRLPSHTLGVDDFGRCRFP